MSNQVELDRACDDCWGQGVKHERERIIALIKGAPTAFEWFQPFVGTTTLIQQIRGETSGGL